MLSKGIEDLRRSGELRQILEKYHMKDWETDSNLTLEQLNNFSPGILESALNLLDVVDTRSL
jgi:polar amino acid transport system substrate-binding protein